MKKLIFIIAVLFASCASTKQHPPCECRDPRIDFYIYLVTRYDTLLTEKQRIIELQDEMTIDSMEQIAKMVHRKYHGSLFDRVSEKYDREIDTAANRYIWETFKQTPVGRAASEETERELKAEGRWWK